MRRVLVAVADIADNATARLVVEPQRLLHRAKIDLPLYAIQTSLTIGAVLRGARNLIAKSKIPRGRGARRCVQDRQPPRPADRGTRS